MTKIIEVADATVKIGPFGPVRANVGRGDEGVASATSAPGTSTGSRHVPSTIAATRVRPGHHGSAGPEPSIADALPDELPAASTDYIGVALGFDTAHSASERSLASVAFGPGKSYPAGNTPVSVATADVNGDGHPDIIVADLYGGVSVLLGNGSGGFGPATSFAAGSGVSSVAVADVNGDGAPDLVVADYNTGVSVLLGNGQGRFGAPTNYTAGTQPIAVATAELNGVGKEDIVAANFKSGNVSVLMQYGGRFAPAVNYAAGIGPDAVTIADLNGDGKLDLAVADFNGGVSVLLGDGHGRFGIATNYAAGPEPNAVAAADLNGDGRTDLIVTDRLGGVSVLLNNGAGGFATPVSYGAGNTPVSVTTADLTGDGLLDIIVANSGGGVSVLLNNGQGGFARAVNYAAGRSPISVTTADVNGDGKPDIIVADQSGGVTVLLNNTTSPGRFLAPVVPQEPQTPTACFAQGTLIATPHGPIAVQDLRAGDTAITDRGGRRIVWVGRRRIDVAAHPRPDYVRPIRFAVGALGDGLPIRPLYLSPDHALLFDGVLIAARQLVNGISITVEDVATVDYFHVELARHAVLFAEGVATESYLDTGNRAQFDGAGSIALHADFSRTDSAEACAPLVTDPAIVQPVWARFAARAGLSPTHVPATIRDADLRLALCGGRVLRPARIEANGRHVFKLTASDGRPYGSRTARLRSNHAAPADLRPWLDDRRQLGVAVGSIAMWTAQRGFSPGALSLDALRPDAGWWPTERDSARSWRWTDGNAAIDLPPDCRRLVVTVSAIAEHPARDIGHRTRAAF